MRPAQYGHCMVQGVAPKPTKFLQLGPGVRGPCLFCQKQASEIIGLTFCESQIKRFHIFTRCYQNHCNVYLRDLILISYKESRAIIWVINN